MKNMYVRPLSEVFENYDFIMGYSVGEQRKWYAGIEGITYIWNGAWNDPEVGYKSYAINESYLDGFWSQYEEECDEDGIQAKLDESYSKWLAAHKDEVFDLLDDVIAAYEQGRKQTDATALAAA